MRGGSDALLVTREGRKARALTVLVVVVVGCLLPFVLILI